MNFDGLKCTLENRRGPILTDFLIFLDQLSLVVNDKKNAMFFTNFQCPSNQDIKLIEHSYDSQIPFFIESTNGQHDIYCYDFEDEAYPKIAIFSDHSFVNKWDSVSDFLTWLDRMASTKR